MSATETQTTRTVYGTTRTITTYETEENGRIYRERELKCECGRKSYSSHGGDFSCDCGREFNASGQELRSNWRANPSNFDSDISDLDGYEMGCRDY